MALALLSSSAFAADDRSVSTIQVRGNDKKNYSRIVFDWGPLSKSTPQYTTDKTSTRLVVTFKKDIHLSDKGFAAQNLSRVNDYKMISPNQVEIGFDDGVNVRHFIADNKLVVDIKGEGHAKTSPTSEEKPVDLAAKIETAAGDTISSEKNIIIDNPVVKEPPLSEQKTDKPYQITMTSTTSIPLAVFDRNGYTWMVQGKDGIKIPPQISGDEAGTLGRFESVPAGEGVSVFRIKRQDNLSTQASGGGLVWKIKFSDAPENHTKPIAYKKIFEKNNTATDPFLIWPATAFRRMTEIKDPDNGDLIIVGLVESAADYTGGEQSFIDFDSLASPIGIAISPKIDDLSVTNTDQGVVIGRVGGLKIAPDKDTLMVSREKAPEKKEDDAPKEISRIFDFKNWQIGTKQELPNNQRMMMSLMGNQTESKKAETLIGLARLALSFNYAPEALGYLELAQSLVPELDGNPEFISLVAAVETLSWKPKEAFQKFSNASLNDVGEIAYWKAFTLAKLDDWQQAAKILPDDMTVLSTYTDDIKIPFTLTLLEVALREGNIAKAKTLIDLVEPLRETMSLPHASAYDYLMGEFDRQTNKAKEAKELWKELSTGADDLYRAKARFASTMMQLDSKEITEDKAVDSLEGLRYAWRGDDLEVAINNNLAKIYLKKGEPVKALTLMDLAQSLNPQSDQGKKIDLEMREAFKNLFKPEKIKDISPVDILILYNEFSKLIPSGAEGEALTRQLAERMATADLLPRATALLKKQVDGGLQGLEGATVAIRLATLQIMDSKPDDALVTLNKAETLLKGLLSEDVLQKQSDIGLLRAKAYSLKGMTDDAFAALSLLPQDDESLRLRADIAWRGKKWQDAADSLEQLVQNQNITLTRPLSDDEADLLLNWGVALYLADNRYVLANLRERYSDAMAATTKAKKFDVVTRPRQGSLLADRETINSIIDETTIFKDFLSSFRSTGSAPESAATSVSPISNPITPPASANIPDTLRNAPGLKTDEVLGD